MTKTDILKLSIYQIQMFLSVAKTENISASARDLHLSASMLSKNIIKMEEEMELILFRREGGRLYLTPAGRIMQEELRSVVDRVELSIQKAKAQQAVEVVPLRIGFPVSVSRKKVLYPIMDAFREKNPSFEYTMEFYEFRDLIAHFQKGSLDVIFTTLFEEASVQALGVEYRTVLTCPLTLYVTEDNPLAGKDSVCFEDFSQMKQLLPYPEKEHNFYSNIINPYFKNASIILRPVYYASSADSVTANLRKPDEVFIGDDNLHVDSLCNLVSIPIRDTKSGIIVAWKKGSNRQTDSFIKHTVSFCKNLSTKA